MVVRKVYHCNNEILEWKWSSDHELMPQPFWTSVFLIDGLLIDADAPGGVDDLRDFINSLNSENTVEKCELHTTTKIIAGEVLCFKKNLRFPYLRVNWLFRY